MEKSRKVRACERGSSGVRGMNFCLLGEKKAGEGG